MTKRAVIRWGAGMSLGLSVLAGQARALDTRFTYQGQLEQSGASTNDTCDFQFSLFDALAAGSQVGTTQTLSSVGVIDGLFTVQLDFGGSPFNGNDRWLQIAVRCPVGNGNFTTLTPRQPLTAAPYSLYAPTAGSAENLNCPGCVGATDLAANSVATAQIQNAAVSPAKINSTGASSGQALVWDGNNVVWGNPATGLTLPFAGTVSSSSSDAFRITNTNSTGGENTFALHGKTTNGGGVLGESAQGDGVVGASDQGTGVTGKSTNGAGVFGRSTLFEGVRGMASDPNHGAVVGFHTFAGIGVYGECSAGVGVQGNSATGKGVVGNSTTDVGVYGVSAQLDGVRGDATNANHSGVAGIHSGNGFGVFGQSVSNSGVVGRSTSGIGVFGESAQFEGVRGVATDPNHGGVVGIHNGGGIGTYGLGKVGVWGDADNNPESAGVVGRGGATGGYFNGSGPQSNALVLNDGGIRVVGAGAGTATPVFTQVVHDGTQGVPDNRCDIGGLHNTIIDSPYTNGNPNAILIITPVNIYFASVAVGYGGGGNCPNDRWHISTTASLYEGLKINVMVINP